LSRPRRSALRHSFLTRISAAALINTPAVSPRRRSLGSAGLLALLLLSTQAVSAGGADLEAARLLYRGGRYDEAAEVAAAEVDAGIWNERWSRLLIRAHLARGRHDEALERYRAAIERYSSSLTLRRLGIAALRSNGLHDEAEQAIAGFGAALRRFTSGYASRDDLVAMGRYFTERGEDARRVLELFYDRVRDADPDYLEAYIATAELALDKGDFKVAAETLEEAESVDGSDPRVFYLQALAWASSDAERANAALRRALELNPRHVDSLLFQVDKAIDRELYEQAESLIRDVLAVNLHEPRAWGYLAVLAHLRGRYGVERLMRAAALSTWGENPEVDHLIGEKLSDKYRFQEGAEYQRRALRMEPKHTGARFQLAQDMLRLGNDEIGWELATSVADADEYNVVAHNLATLRERVEGFRVLGSEQIDVRMDPREAAIYGDDVVGLLQEARDVLFKKYDVRLEKPVIVEIFPRQQDFAIRTFGLPGGAGFLGVCFGRLITANSPASQGERPPNWKSVLWHEFCHVATLGKTNNRMPRWLSEGISVYEERQRGESWGERMTPQYREMLLGEELTPVSKLSGAFLNPPSPVHLQFAYYESSLVVEFLIERYGVEALKSILDDLGAGLMMRDALARSVGSPEKLDVEFAEYVRGRAEAFGSELDWSREGFPERPSPDALSAFLEAHPDNYWGLVGMAQAHLAAERYGEAAELLQRVREAGAASGERGGPLEMLARVYREQGETEKEREALQTLVRESCDALAAYQRLAEMAREEGDWQSVMRYAEGILAIHPLLPVGHRERLAAAEQLGQSRAALASLRALAEMDPVDPAGLHYRTATALADLDRHDEAKRHVLLALADAPRYRDALELLLEIRASRSGGAELRGGGDDSVDGGGLDAGDEPEADDSEADGSEADEPNGDESEAEASDTSGRSAADDTEKGSDQ